jgi:hypothetical protein
MSRYLVAFLLCAVGFGLGMTYGNVVAPVQYIDTDPGALRVDYRSDYVLMVAERYAADHDAVGAVRRLAVLGPQGAERTCIDAIQFASSAAYSRQDLEMMQELLRAVQEQTLPASTAETAQ